MATTQVEQDNVALVRRGFEAFAAADMGALERLFSADATWHGPELGILAANYAGRDAIFAMFGQLATETNGSFRAVPGVLAGAGDRVFVECVATGSRQGRTLESDEILVFTMRDGTVRDVRLYVHDHAANVRFWS